jgi:molybdate transport system regulatory protein
MSDPNLSIRIDLPGGRFGPGKAALLRAIDDCGSIAAAARTLGMSYARAWSLTEQMNRCFGQRLVETYAGGNRRGGARLTPVGERVLGLYARIEEKAARAASGELKRLAAMTA